MLTWVVDKGQVTIFPLICDAVYCVIYIAGVVTPKKINYNMARKDNCERQIGKSNGAGLLSSDVGLLGRYPSFGRTYCLHRQN